MTYVYIAAALLVGLIIGYLFAKVQSNALRTRVEVLSSQLEERQKSFDSQLLERQKSFDSQLDERQKSFERELEEKERDVAQALQLQERHHREAVEEMQRRFEETVSKMKAELSELTSDMLRRRQSEFAESSTNQMSKILEPLNRSIAEMQKTVADNTLRHTEFGGKLDANIRLVLEHSDAARKSADRLADALKGSGKVQGAWGETVLTELLESQGLTQGVHFETQPTLRDAAGNPVLSDRDRKLRPDVLLHLDRERVVVIDAKVSLSDYLDFMQADSEYVREAALQAHIRSLENHVGELAGKNYSAYIQAGMCSVDYVIMFVPNTAALYAATSRKPELWRKAMERGVYIADEQTLYAALKIIDLTWRQIAQAENHEKVFRLAGEMLDRVAAFIDKFQTMGRKIDETQKYYNEAWAKLQDQGQSIPQTCRKLQKLGASGKKTLKLPDSAL